MNQNNYGTISIYKNEILVFKSLNFRTNSLIESTKTTSKENVTTGVLEKNKEYLRSKDKAKK